MATHERIMTITYRCDEWENNTYEKAAQWLHQFGISLINKYRWVDSVPEDEKYGWQTKTEDSKSYEILIDGTLAFALEYRSEANTAFEQLCENGFDADMRTVTTTKQFDDYMTPNGDYCHMWLDRMEAEQSYNGVPHMKYSNELKMTPNFRQSPNGYTLTLMSSYTPSSVRNKKQIAKALVDTPMNDMKSIIGEIETCLKSYCVNGYPLEYDIDCVSYTRSETSAKCDPDTISKVMKND